MSLDPPLVSFSVMKASTTYPRIRDAGRFAVNILSREQESVSNQFARKGTDKWANVRWTQSEGGNPVLDGTLAWLDCSIWAEYDAGDHLIILGRVHELGTSENPAPDPPSLLPRTVSDNDPAFSSYPTPPPRSLGGLARAGKEPL